MNPSELDRMLTAAFRSFYEDLSKSRGAWFGKERDCVNRFVMGHLVLLCVAGRYAIKDPAQIGIEVAVGQPKKLGRKPTIKPTAHKDVVIWEKPSQTCWNRRLKLAETPWAVIEWKIRPPGKPRPNRQHDREWLAGFAAENRGRLGYSVLLEWDAGWWPERLTVDRWQGTSLAEGWFQAHGRVRKP